jgi:radical SAM protein with 4Fe4S-binding SPASM domain
MIRLVSSLPIALWNVYFLVPLERGGPLAGLTPAQFELVFERLYRLTFEAAFDLNLVEAQHFRRFVARRQAAGDLGVEGRGDRAVNAGDGALFIDHAGGICPSEFFPEIRGDIRSDSLAAVYREDPLFVALRDRGRLTGKCWVCEYHRICGGSRARLGDGRRRLGARPRLLLRARDHALNAQFSTTAPRGPFCCDVLRRRGKG